MKLLRIYKDYIYDLILRNQEKDGETLEFWKARILYTIILFFGPFSLLAYTPALIITIQERIWSILILDTVIFIVLNFVLYSRAFSIVTKKIFIVICLYILGAGLLFFMGNFGPGILYLLALSCFSALVISKPAGIATFYVNLGLYLLIGFFLHLKLRVFTGLEYYDFESWMGVGANLVLLNLVLVYSINMLVTGLSRKIESEYNMRKYIEKENVELQIARNRAEEADRLKSAFLANMSHEIRTPMNAIVGFSELLHSRQVDDDKKKRYSQIILNNSELLLSIMDQIIDLSKIDAGVIRIDQQHFSLNEFIEPLVSNYKLLCPENLVFSVDLAEDLTEMEVLSDPNKISQILNNLVSNAFKFTPEGEVRLILEKEGAYLLFSVQDTGSGIPAHALPKIFDRFYQVVTHKSGVGLGLSISKSLAELLGGSLEVSSEAGKGSRFTLRIPAIS